MKVYKATPPIHFCIGHIVTVMPWGHHRGQVIGIHIDHRNCVYYDVELIEPYGANTYRRAKFTKGQLLSEEKIKRQDVRVCISEKCKYNRFRYGEAACNLKEIEIIDGKCKQYEGVDV